jgi:hypothetical protein
MVKYLYVNGDCWLAHTSCQEVLHHHNSPFQDLVVINRSAPSSNNLDIIRRTKSDLAHLAAQGIDPLVCIGLAEIGNGGHDYAGEFRLAKPNQDLAKVLQSIIDTEVAMLQEAVGNRKSYICNSYCLHTFPTKGVIHFVDQDWSNFGPVYRVTKGLHRWMLDRQNIFKFSTESFDDLIGKQRQYVAAWLANPYIDDYLHLPAETEHNRSTFELFHKFFTHVADSLDI